MVEYESIRVSKPVKSRLDGDKGEGETRNEQIERLLSDNDVLPFDEALEQRLKAIESELGSVPNETAEIFERRFL